MTEKRNTVYIPTWMDTSIPGLRDPYGPKFGSANNANWHNQMSGCISGQLGPQNQLSAILSGAFGALNNKPWE